MTNPPIDAIREEIVTSTSVYAGKDGNLLVQQPENCRVLKILHPILTNTDMLKIKNLKQEGLRSAVVSTLYYKSTRLERAMDRLFCGGGQGIPGRRQYSGAFRPGSR